MKTIVLTLAVLLSATAISFAQSLPNFGPNAPSYGDSYGKPVSGTYPPVGTADMHTSRTGTIITDIGIIDTGGD